MAVRVWAPPLLLILPLAACAAPSAPSPLPFAVQGGRGEELGNYAAAEAGEVEIDGQRCRVWNWDRPFSATQVLRYRSASCPSLERPGRFTAVELGHELVPLSESELRHELPSPGL